MSNFSDVYSRQGYLVIEGFISHEECDVLRRRSLEIVHQQGPILASSISRCLREGKSQEQFYLDAEATLCVFFEKEAFGEDKEVNIPLQWAVSKISHALHDLDPVFDRFSRLPLIKTLVAGLRLGMLSPVLAQSMYHFKQPFIGSAVVCHQDASFLYTEPESTTALWFALEDASVENGCLWVLPAGHDAPLKYRCLRTPENSVDYVVYDSSPWPIEKMIPLEVPKGSLIVLHGRIPHMSHANRSSQSRHAYSLHLIDGHSHYPKNNWLQRSPAFPFRGL